MRDFADQHPDYFGALNELKDPPEQKKSWDDYGQPAGPKLEPKEKVYHNWQHYNDENPKPQEDTRESIGDKMTDPAPSMEFVSNKFYVKFTPTGVEFYRRGELVHTSPGDYSHPTRGNYNAAKAVTNRLWKKEHQQSVEENFADGKNPGRKGLSKRMGVNTKASVSSLRNTAKHSTGEKARMAHWLANMKAGRAKHNK